MSYARLPLPCQDFQLGFRTVQQSIRNNDEMWTTTTAKHLKSPRNYPGDTYAGRHNDYFVPRAVACWFPAQNIDGTWFAGGTSPHFGASFGVPILRDTGRWRIPVNETSALLVTGAPILNGVGTFTGATIGRKVDVRLFLPGPGNGSYVDVTTWDIDSSTTAPATAFMPFSLTLWARR